MIYHILLSAEGGTLPPQPVGVAEQIDQPTQERGSSVMMLLNSGLEDREMVAVGERVYYLSLALDARRALNAIRAASKGSVRPEELQDSIRVATQSLEALSANADLYAKLSPDHYVQYEEIQTLREVISPLDPGPLVQSLKSLLASNVEAPTTEDLDSARKFFRALESRAMHHYNDPASGDALMA